MATEYKGCRIYRSKRCNGLFVWDEPMFGSESDDAFPTLELAKADVDRFFENGRSPRIINGEITA